MTSPLYRKIASELRERIANGSLAPGDRLPTEAALMDHYGVSRNTVRLATGALINEGLVMSVPGRNGGMVVREQITLSYHASRAEMPDGLYSESDAYFGEVRGQGYEPSQEFETRIVSLPAEHAARLGIDEGSSAVLRRCVRSINGRRNSIQDSFYPEWLTQAVPQLRSPRDIAIGTTRLLRDEGYLQVAFIDEITARMPTPEEAELLELRAGTPVLSYVRTAHTVERPVRVTVTTFAGDSNRMVYTLGDTEVIQRADRSPE